MEPRVIRIVPELRRGALYAMIGFSVLATATFWIGLNMLDRDAVSTSTMSSVFLMLAAVTVVPLRWALRVDDTGIHRRFLFRWDFWPWSDFASGRLTKCGEFTGEFTFVDPARPWWRRWLTLDLADPAELPGLIQLVNTHYRMPPAPPPPDMVRVRYSWRRVAEFDRAEIRLVIRGKMHHFGWKEVQSVRIWRHDELRRDFVAMELTLPGHTIWVALRPHQGLVSITWTRKMTVDLSALLLACVPAERLAIDIWGVTPLRTEDLCKRLQALHKTRRDMHWILGFTLVALAAFFGLIASDKGILAGLATISFFLVVLLLVGWFNFRDLRKAIARTEAEVADAHE